MINIYIYSEEHKKIMIAKECDYLWQRRIPTLIDLPLVITVN